MNALALIAILPLLIAAWRGLPARWFMAACMTAIISLFSGEIAVGLVLWFSGILIAILTPVQHR